MVWPLGFLGNYREIGNGVQPAFSKGMAAAKTTQRQPGTPQETEANECYVGVLGTGRQIFALRRTHTMKYGREDPLIKAEKETHGKSGFGLIHRTVQKEIRSNAVRLLS